jgi:hypothetical protein
MPTSVGPNTAGDNNLVFAIDAADKKNSMLPFSTFLNMSSWTVGNGSVGSYSQNGSTAENQRLAGTDPFGNSTIVWQSNPEGTNADDGGWNNGYYDIDRTKLYRWSVWVKRTSNSTGGTSYLGLNASGGTWGIDRLDGGGVEGNPYWQCVNISAYEKDVWYLLVGHCYPTGTTGIPGNVHPDSGRYITSGRNGTINYCNIGGDVRWLADSTVGAHRAYHYYCADNTSHLQWFDPRFEVCDGTQPTIQDLLTTPPTYTRSAVGTNKGELVNGTTWTANKGGSLAFDGTNDYVNLATNIQSGFTQATYEFVCKPTSLPSGTYYQLYIQEASTWIALYNYAGVTFFGIDLGNGTGWFDDNGGYNTGARTTATLTANQYYHVVYSWNGNSVSVYLNGTLQSTASTLQASNGRQNVTTLGAGTTSRNIGSRYNGSSVNWVGTIDVVKFYNKALTVSEVQQNFQQYKSRFNIS